MKTSPSPRKKTSWPSLLCVAAALNKAKKAQSTFMTNFCFEFLQQRQEEKRNLWIYNVVALKVAVSQEEIKTARARTEEPKERPPVGTVL